MKKSITKKAKPISRKRPKSVLAKAWETRRAKAELKKFWDEAAPAKPPKLQGGFIMQPELEEEIASLAKATPTSETATPRSENEATANGVNAAFDAIVRSNVMHRDEMLLGFMGDMAAMRRVTNSGHYPVMVSRAQAKAIETFLDEHGYSPWGHRGTGNSESSEVAKAA